MINCMQATDGDEDVGQNTTEANYVFRIRNENLNAPGMHEEAFVY